MPAVGAARVTASYRGCSSWNRHEQSSTMTPTHMRHDSSAQNRTAQPPCPCSTVAAACTPPLHLGSAAGCGPGCCRRRPPPPAMHTTQPAGSKRLPRLLLPSPAGRPGRRPPMAPRCLAWQAPAAAAARSAASATSLRCGRPSGWPAAASHRRGGRRSALTASAPPAAPLPAGWQGARRRGMARCCLRPRLPFYSHVSAISRWAQALPSCMPPAQRSPGVQPSERAVVATSRLTMTPPAAAAAAAASPGATQLPRSAAASAWECVCDRGCE